MARPPVAPFLCPKEGWCTVARWIFDVTGLESLRPYRIDTAAGSSSAATIYRPGTSGTISGAILKALPGGTLPRFEATTATLYAKPLNAYGATGVAVQITGRWDLDGVPRDTESPGTDGWLRRWARNPDALITGDITRDADTGALLSAPVVWPDGTTGVLTGTPTQVRDASGELDSWTVTYVNQAGTRTVTQPPLQRGDRGEVITVPAITVT